MSIMRDMTKIGQTNLRWRANQTFYATVLICRQGDGI